MFGVAGRGGVWTIAARPCRNDLIIPVRSRRRGWRFGHPVVLARHDCRRVAVAAAALGVVESRVGSSEHRLETVVDVADLGDADAAGEVHGSAVGRHGETAADFVDAARHYL